MQKTNLFDRIRLVVCDESRKFMQTTNCKLLALLLTLLWCNGMSAQTENGCGFVAPMYLQQQANIPMPSTPRPPILNFTHVVVPIVVHCVTENVLDATQQADFRKRVIEQIETLNNDFAGANANLISALANNVLPNSFKDAIYLNDSKIQFCLATRDQQGNSFSGILFIQSAITSFDGNNHSVLNGISNGWNINKFLNLYIAPTLTAGTAPVAGYAVVATPTPIQGSDGIAVRDADFGKNQSALTHEAGHWLGLLHTWGNGASCADDDDISDTPTQYENSTQGLSNLTAHYDICTPAGDGIMFMNFMNYYNKIYMFSSEQITVMRSNFVAGGARIALGNTRNTNCIPAFSLSANTNLCANSTSAIITVTPPRGYALSDFTVQLFNSQQQPIPFVVTGTNQITATLTRTTTVRVVLSYAFGTVQPPVQIENSIRIYKEQAISTAYTFQPLGQTNAATSIIPNTYIWSVASPAFVNANIKIDDGVTLIIKDKVLMPPNQKIIVSPGGKLIIEKGGILTSCSSLWGGIEVLSNTLRKGTLTINNAVIEYASVGVSSGTVIKGISGANINIKNSVFKNNVIGLLSSKNTFLPSYSGSIDLERDTFTIDNNYNSRATTRPTCISLKSSYGINLKGNTFEDVRTTPTTTTDKAVGISAYATDFVCQPSTLIPTSIEPNTFRALSYAILAQGGFAAGLEKVILFANKIEGCDRGIYATAFSAFSDYTITNQGLKIIQNSITSGTDYGIYIEQSKFFEVENNTIFGTKQGIIILNCGEQANKVYRNNFVKTGNIAAEQNIIAWGANRSIDKTQGLQILCNKLESNTAHIWLKGVTNNNAPIPHSGIREKQGTEIDPLSPNTQLPAGNQFPIGSTVPDFADINTSGIKLYYYHNSVTSTATERVQPLTIPTSVGPQSQQVTFEYNASCPDHYAQYVPTITSNNPNTPDMTTLWQQRITGQTQKHILTQTLQNLEDGGNTPLLENEVEMTQIQNAYTLYANLMAKSPYLSEEVLAELAEKENFPKALIRDIMVANKHAGKDATVVDKLENRTDELPEYMLTQIKNAAASGMSGKELLENSINAQTEDYEKAINLQVSTLNSDSTASIADYEAVLATTTSMTHQAELVEAYLRLGTTTEIADAIQNFEANTTQTNENTSEISDYVTLYNTILSIKNRNDSTDSLTTDEINTLISIAGSENAAQVNVRLLLEIATNTRTYIEPLPIWIPQPAMRKAKKVAKVKNTIPFAAVFPNPAKDYINFEFSNTIEENTALSIYNTEGKLVHTYNIRENKNSYTLPIHTWANGVYFYNINTNNALIEKGKFEVIH